MGNHKSRGRAWLRIVVCAPTLAAVLLVLFPAAGSASHPGCSVQCIKSGKVVPQFRSAKVTLATSAPAELDVYVGRQSTLETLKNPDVHVTSSGRVLEWGKGIRGLMPGTSYYIVVRATDVHGNRAFQQGQFKTRAPHRNPAAASTATAAADPTAKEPRTVMVSFDQIHVEGDADKGKNPGEIRFSFRVNGQGVFSRGEDRIKSGTIVPLGGSYRLTISDAPEELRLSVFGMEDDVAKCVVEAAESYDTNFGSSGTGCDYSNAAASFDLTEGSADSLPYFAFSTGNQYLKFTVIGHYSVS